MSVMSCNHGIFHINYSPIITTKHQLTPWPRKLKIEVMPQHYSENFLGMHSPES